MRQLYGAIAVAVSVLAGTGGSADAASIPSAVIMPQEYDLPLNFTPIGEFVTYASVNDNNSAYATDGRPVDGPGGTSWTALPKFAYLAPLGRHFGYELEALLPIERITGPVSRAVGAGAPIFAPVIWFKPSGNTTLGADVLFQPAWGVSRYASYDRVVTPTVFFDANAGCLNLDGDVGVSMPGVRSRSLGGVRDPGNTVFTNLRLAYRVAPRWEPFLSVDWQVTRYGRDAVGQRVPGSDSRELALGAGVLWTLTTKTFVGVSYSQAVAGANVVQTHALYLRYVRSWNL